MTRFSLLSTARAAGCLVALMVGLPQGGAHAGADRLSFTLTAVPAPARTVAALPLEVAQAPAGGAAVAAAADVPLAQKVAPRAAPVVRTVAPGEARFDLAVHEAPAAQVFLQLGFSGSHSMLVSPEVTGNVTLKLRQTTVPEALEALRELYGYDYRIASGNRVFVYPNTAQTRLFRISYLPGRRQGASDLRVNSNFVMQANSGSGGGGGNAANGGSADTTSVRMTSDTNFWGDVQESLKSLLGGREGRSVTLNPGAGVIVVRATPAELRQVGEYLRAVQLTIERQVMLEAKIIEVRLSDSSQMGVNWSLFRQVTHNGRRGTVGTVGVTPGATLTNDGALGTAAGSVLPNVAAAADSLGKGFYGLAFQSASFAALVTFLETQGEVRVLSSPRIATINNQKAVLKVGRDELFVTNITTNQTSTGNSTTSSPTVTLQPFFSGIALDVTPQIDDNGTVMLHVHPTVSVVTERQKPIDLGTLGRYTLPLASSSINETDSIVRVRDGEVVAIGGLMQQDSSSDRSGVPGLSEAPVVGGLFRQKSTARSKYELVILIKPTIVTDEAGSWPQPDGPAAAEVAEATGQR